MEATAAASRMLCRSVLMGVAAAVAGAASANRRVACYCVEIPAPSLMFTLSVRPPSVWLL